MDRRYSAIAAAYCDLTPSSKFLLALNRERRGLDGLWTSLAFAVICSLTAAISGCGNDVTISTSQLLIQVTPGTVDFGNVSLGQSAVSSVAITNPSPKSIVISHINVSGQAFSVVGATQLPIQIPAGGTRTLNIGFAPSSSNSYSGSLTIGSNSTTGSTVSVALSGTGTSAPSPELAISASSLSFGSDTLNTAKLQTLTLMSTGTSAVTVNTATISGAGFTLVAGTFPQTLAPGHSLTLQLQFKPATAGAASGSLTIGSSSTTGSTVLVALSGTGTGVPSPQLAISASSLSFGSDTVNTATDLTLTLMSTGTSAVTVNAAAITGAGFTIVGGMLPATLAPSQSLVLQVQFQPVTAGAASGSLTIGSNSTTGSTVSVGLSGTGTAVAHAVDLSWSAPVSSPVPVTGYKIYRAISGGTFAVLNSSPNSSTDYVDSTVLSGASYDYFVRSVDSSGGESVASNEITEVIP